MKIILRKNNIFQKILESAIYIFRLCFDALPEVQPRPNVCYDNPERQLLKQAVTNFELKKRGAR